MPNASAPNAPWVAVCESPQTIVMPGWVTPSSGPDHVHDALAVGAHRVDGTPNSAQLRSSVSTCTRESSSRMRAATGVPSVGTLWSAVASVRSGRRTGRPASRSPSNACGLVDLVDQVQVDVEQARRDLVGGPDLVEQRLAHERRSPADTTASRAASSFPWFSKWCGRSASKVTLSPARARGARRRSAASRCRSRPPRSRARRARASAGRRGRRWTRRARARGGRPRRAGRAAAA